MKYAIRMTRCGAFAVSLALGTALMMPATNARAAALDADVVEKISGAAAATQSDGVVKIGWPRTDVAVTVDGVALPAAAGLGSWAAFSPMPNGAAMVMGDTVVFADEVDAAMDAAFAHGLDVTAIHNHFFHDTPAVYFMHIGGEGSVENLAGGVRAVWDAIRAVRAAHAQPAPSFGGPEVGLGHVDADAIAKIVGQPATDTQGVAKVTIGRSGTMQGMAIGGSMGLTTWAAFSGTDSLAAMDGDFIMTAAEVRPVLVALRGAGVHIVALHSHMIGETPNFFFTHFWAKGKAADLAKGLRSALDAQAAAGKS
jgi:hypothetical protein